MIRIHRPAAEPARLTQQRERRLPRAIKALNGSGAASKALKDTLKDYDGGKKQLYLAQRRKCAYCERRVGFGSNPVEHFRPKREAWRHQPGKTSDIDGTGYWWLTWTWENQLFACPTCNGSHKRNYFPLATAARLGGPSAPYPHDHLLPAHTALQAESPLLVDPATEDPLDHLDWRPVNPGEPKKLWKWAPLGLTPRGEATIELLGMDELADDVGDHLRDHVVSRAEEICRLVDAGDVGSAVAGWAALANDVVRSDCLLAGPTWNALRFLVDEPRRIRAALALPPRP